MNLRERALAFAALGEPHRLAIVDLLAHTDLTPGELAAQTSLPSNLLAHHLRLLEAAGLVVRSKSEGDGRRHYVRLAPDRLRLLLGGDRDDPGRVTFVCTHNSARSQFAAARFAQLAGTAAESAGSHPAPAIHPGAVRAARRYGLDLSALVPRGYTDLSPSDTLVSVCDRAREHGLPPHRRHLHWSVPDPTRTAAFDDAFAEIDRRLVHLLGA